MVASHVQVAPDGSGKDIDADALTSSEGGNPTVYRQNIVLGDPATYGSKAKIGAGGDLSMSITSPAAALLGMFGSVTPYGSARVSGEPAALFFDPIDGAAVDVANRWSTGGTQVPTQANSNITVAATVGVNVANSSTLISQPSFVSSGFGLNLIGCDITLEAAQVNAVNVHRFWGKGQVTAYTYATPVTDGVGFEVEGTVGALQCVVWIGGTRYVLNSTNSALISSSVAGAGGSGTILPGGASGTNFGQVLTWKGGVHRYAIFERADGIFWYIESLETPVAMVQYATPNVGTLPLRVASVTNGAATSLAHTFQVGAIGVGDSASQNQMLSDGAFQWRKAKVGAAGELSTRRVQDTARVTSNLFMAAPVITTTAEVMQSLTGYKSGAAVAATVTPAVVTAGKTWRVSRVTISYTAATVIGGALVRLRANLSGVAVVTSPLVMTWYTGNDATFTAGETSTYVFDYPEGLEFAAGTGVAVGVLGGGAVPTTGTITGFVLVAIEGFEY